MWGQLRTLYFQDPVVPDFGHFLSAVQINRSYPLFEKILVYRAYDAAQCCARESGVVSLSSRSRVTGLFLPHFILLFLSIFHACSIKDCCSSSALISDSDHFWYWSQHIRAFQNMRRLWQIYIHFAIILGPHWALLPCMRIYPRWKSWTCPTPSGSYVLPRIYWSYSMAYSPSRRLSKWNSHCCWSA